MLAGPRCPMPDDPGPPDLGPFHSRYTDLRPLAGTAPAVYRATSALGVPVLLKVMPRLSADASVQSALFLRGARAVARVDHPNVVRVLDLFSTGSADVLVQEAVDGPTLADLLRGPDAVPPDRAVALAAELADALAAVHAGGLVHCNLGPAEVQLTGTGSAKLGG
ncbi:MAG: protein kinase, partial [Gemmataceae bacterium]|nr:protein kinase [Gemmataceae bacterium]